MVHPLAQFLAQGHLYGITDLRYRWASHQDCAQAMVEAGVRLVQYRGKDLPWEQQRAELLALVPWARERGAWVVVNDHLDLALLSGADGLHLGQGDLDPARARALLGPKVALGLSTHNRVQAQAALGLGIDYLGVGPAYATPSKPEEPEAGLGFLAWTAKEIGLPQVAIGGIQWERLPEVLNTGQRSVAMIEGLLGAPDLKAQVARIEARLAQGQPLG